MSRTVQDLVDSVKRYLTSNTTLISTFQGQPQSEASLAEQLDLAILQGANNARKWVESRHDFSANDKTGRVLSTWGSVVNKNRIALTQYFEDIDSLSFGKPKQIKSGMGVWPVLVLEPQISKLVLSGEVTDGVHALELGDLYLYTKTDEGQVWSSSGSLAIPNEGVYIKCVTGIGILGHIYYYLNGILKATWESTADGVFPEFMAWLPSNLATGNILINRIGVVAFDVSRLSSFKFYGEVSAPLETGVDYAVISTQTNANFTVDLVFGGPRDQELYAINAEVLGTTADLVRFKTITQAYFVHPETGGLVPITSKTRRFRNMEVSRQKPTGYQVSPRYQAGLHDISEMIVYNYGKTLELFPPQKSIKLAFDGNVWMSDYTSMSDTDFILEDGFEFMMWQTVLEVNYMLLKFVARQEGTISPPTAARDMALMAFIDNDATEFDGNSYSDIQ